MTVSKRAATARHSTEWPPPRVTRNVSASTCGAAANAASGSPACWVACTAMLSLAPSWASGAPGASAAAVEATAGSSW